nr:putative late blight resistance protein homolog R1B-16 isoform X1 [Ipomoea batatas]
MLQSTSRNSQATDCHQSSRTTNNISSSIVDTSQPEYGVKATHFNKSQHQPLAQEAGTKKCLKRKEPDYYSDEGWVRRFIDPGDENIKEGENDCEDIVRYAGPVVYPKPFMPANEFYWLLGVDSRDLNGEAFAQNVIIQGETKAKVKYANSKHKARTYHCKEEFTINGEAMIVIRKEHVPAKISHRLSPKRYGYFKSSSIEACLLRLHGIFKQAVKQTDYLKKKFIKIQSEQQFAKGPSITGVSLLGRMLQRGLLLDKMLHMANLVHLRYLALSQSAREDVHLHKLKLFEHWNMQSFIVRGFGVILDSSEASRIWKMPLLRNFYVDIIPFTLEASEVVHRNIETISWLHPKCCAEDLFTRIPNLKRLGIQGELLFGYKNSDGFYNFVHLGQLEKLSIKLWDLKLPYKGIPWATSFLPNLKKLKFFRTRLPWSDMKLIGMLSNLEILKLIDACEGKEWEPCEGGFRQLKMLVIGSICLKYWNAVGDHFPVIEHLELTNCISLREIPIEFADITTLACIQLTYCPDSVLASAKRIQDEQQRYGIDTLLVRSKNIKQYLKLEELMDVTRVCRTLGMPEVSHPDHAKWQRVNNIVMSWILNSIHPSLAHTVLYAPDATTVERRRLFQFLMGLRETYSQARNQLLRINSVLQTVKGVYALLLQVEKQRTLDHLGTLIDVAALQAAKQNSNMSVNFQHDFHTLTGTSFTQPMPNNFQTPVFPQQATTQSASQQHPFHMLQNNSHANIVTQPRFGNNRSKPRCTHCGILGHTQQVCYKLYGYPPGHKYFKKVLYYCVYDHDINCVYESYMLLLHHRNSYCIIVKLSIMDFYAAYASS